MKTRVRTIRLLRGDVRELRIYRNRRTQPVSLSMTTTGQCRSSKSNLACRSAKRSGRRWAQENESRSHRGRNLEEFLLFFVHLFLLLPTKPLT